MPNWQTGCDMTVNEEILEGIIRVRNLIKDEVNWTKKVAARDFLDYPVMFYSQYACKFCLIGACLNLYSKGDINYKVETYLNNQVEIGLAYFNDSSTHKQVLEFLDNCIDKLKIKINEEGV